MNPEAGLFVLTFLCSLTDLCLCSRCVSALIFFVSNLSCCHPAPPAFCFLFFKEFIFGEIFGVSSQPARSPARSRTLTSSGRLSFQGERPITGEG